MEEPKEGTAEAEVKGEGAEEAREATREAEPEGQHLTNARVDELFEDFLATVPEPIRGMLRKTTPERRRDLAEAHLGLRSVGGSDEAVQKEIIKIEKRAMTGVDDEDLSDQFANAMAKIQTKMMAKGSKMTGFSCIAKVVSPVDGAMVDFYAGTESGTIEGRKKLLMTSVSAMLRLLKKEMDLDEDDAFEMIQTWFRAEKFEKEIRNRLVLRSANKIAKEREDQGKSPSDDPILAAALGRIFAENKPENFKKFLDEMLGGGGKGHMSQLPDGAIVASLKDLMKTIPPGSEDFVGSLREMISKDGSLCRKCPHGATCKDSPHRDRSLESTGGCNDQVH